MRTGRCLLLGQMLQLSFRIRFWGYMQPLLASSWMVHRAPQGWYPSQRLQVHEALHAYTIGAAFAGLAERSLGRIVPGYLADL